MAQGINNAFLGASSIGSIATKLFQAGWGFHAARECLKGVENPLKRFAAISSFAVAGAVVSAASLPIQAARASKFAVFSVAAGTSSVFFGKWLRNTLLPKKAPQPSEPSVESSILETRV